MVSNITLIYTVNYLFFSLSVHFILVDVYGILHRDVSINNILIFICDTAWTATSHDQQEREAIIASKKFRRGLLIDFDYADFLDAGKQGVSSGDRTVGVFI